MYKMRIVCFFFYDLRCCVVGVDGSKLDLSLRRSGTGEPADDTMETDTEGEGEEREMGVAGRSCDPEIASLEDLEVGKVVRGFVKAVTDVGVFVRYGSQVERGLPSFKCTNTLYTGLAEALMVVFK